MDLQRSLLACVVTDGSLNYPGQTEGHFTYARPLAPGISLVLVLDLPRTLHWVSDGELANLPQTLDEFFDLALSNVAQIPRTCTNLTDDGLVRIVEGD